MTKDHTDSDYFHKRRPQGATEAANEGATDIPPNLVAEAHGLALLRTAATRVNEKAGKKLIRVPAVHSVSPTELVSERVKTANTHAQRVDAMALLGRGLAMLHRMTRHGAEGTHEGDVRYGLNCNNWIGDAPQYNCPQSSSWGEFFVERRLRDQLRMVKDRALRHTYEARLVACAPGLIRFLDAHCKHPSLLHGDLWGGNALCDEHGHGWLIDPAAYYGDREADVAMTEMFGSFDAAFYKAYDHEFPRTPLYAKKRAIYNTYHYLNHWNMFGEKSYAAGADEGFRVMEEVAAAMLASDDAACVAAGKRTPPPGVAVSTPGRGTPPPDGSGERKATPPPAGSRPVGS